MKKIVGKRTKETLLEVREQDISKTRVNGQLILTTPGSNKRQGHQAITIRSWLPLVEELFRTRVPE